MIHKNWAELIKPTQLVVKPGAGAAISRHMERYYEEVFGLSPRFFHVDPAALGRAEPFTEVPCRS